MLFVPVENTYAAFEVKPETKKTLADYAGEEIASVRALHRNSAGIRHAGGYYEPQDLAKKPILGGLLAVRFGWTDITGEAAGAALTALDDDHRIDVGIALDALLQHRPEGRDRLHRTRHPARLLRHAPVRPAAGRRAQPWPSRSRSTRHTSAPETTDD